MKNRILPFSVFLFAIGLSIFLFSSSFLQKQEFSSPNDVPPSNSGKAFKPAAEYLAKIRNNQVTGQIDFRDVVQAREQLENLHQNPNRSEVIDWKLRGPNNIGGRTRALLFDNTDESNNTLIAASVSGGIYKSTNLGLTWNKINGWEKSLKVSCIVQDDQGNVYVGTGESFAAQDLTVFGPLGYNGGFIGTGMYQSTDRENFNRLEATKPVMNSDTAAWAFINELAFNATNGYLLASTNRGLRFSSDAGTSWSIAKTGEGESLVGNSFDVKVGSDGKIITDIDNLCYISSSGNPEQFVLVSRGDSASLPLDGLGRIEFAFAPSDPDIVYASVVKSSGAAENIYASEDGGNDWRVIAPGGTSALNFFGHGVEIGSGQGIYDNCITVFPDDPYRVILGGVNLWEGQKFNDDGFYQWTLKSRDVAFPGIPFALHEDQHSIVFKPGSNSNFIVTNDGGIFLGQIGPSFYEFSTGNKAFYSAQYYTVGHSGKKRKMVGGTQDNGVLLTEGYGPSATVLEAEPLPLYNGGDGGYSFISSIDENAYIVSDHVLGTVSTSRTDDGATSYSNSFIDGFTIPDNTFLLTSLLWEDFENFNSRDSIYFYSRQNSFAAGDEVLLNSKNLEYPFYYTLPTTLGPNDSIHVQDVVSSKFFIAITDELWMTTQALDFTALPPEWFMISNRAQVGFEGNPQCIAVSSDANYAWVGTREGSLYRISNIALAYDYDRADVRSPFCQISTTAVPVYEPGTATPITQAITSISVDPNNPNQVMITLGNYGNDAYVYTTTNALAEIPDFSPAQGNLPKMPVYSCLIEMSPDNNMAIIGTEMGAFVSNNIWASTPEWMLSVDEIDEAIGETPIFMLTQQRIAQQDVPVWEYDGIDSTLIYVDGTDNYGVIYAATFGRGLFFTDQFQKPVGIGEPLPGHLAGNDLLIYPNPVRDHAYVDLMLEEASSIQVFIFDINGKIIVRNNLGKQPAGTMRYELNCSQLPSGTYFLKLVAGRSMETAKFVVNQ